MRVRELIAALQQLPPDAHVYIDTDENPSVDGAYEPEPDPDAWQRSVVLLEVTYPNIE